MTQERFDFRYIADISHDEKTSQGTVDHSNVILG